MDEWHKPALDGIGYQDSLNGERAWWTDYVTADPDLKRTSAGKTVAWINYMTNVNRTFGNFACYRDWETDRKSTRLNSSHITRPRMPSSA